MYFPQEHPPGREAQIDFTHCGELKVTIVGQPYRHLLFQLILSHSGWRYAEVAAGETFLALQQGLQNALWTLGGVPQVVRSDNTSAATHEVKRSRGRALNDNYAGLLDHYGLRSTRINRGQSHENGVAEQAHYRLKDAIDQALILRGSRDFDTADDYAGFVRQMVERRNRLVEGKLEQETLCLGSLPPAPVPEYVNYQARVRKWSTIPYSRRTQPSGPTASPPVSSARRCRSVCTPTGWQCTTRTTWWNGWSACMASGKPTSIIATSSARWCASREPLPATASGSSCFPPCTLGWPTTRCGSGVGSVPTWSTYGSCTWRRPPWKPRYGSHGGQRGVVAAGGG